MCVYVFSVFFFGGGIGFGVGNMFSTSGNLGL